LVCDITRPVPNGSLLPPLVEALAAAGVSRKNITILVATGLHRPNEGKELRQVIRSDAVFDTVRMENHFGRDLNAHADLGVTASGIPILIDRRFVEADLRIVVGLVEPHFMAGYSGGRKLVVPGVAHSHTIFKLHSAAMLNHGKAANTVIAGNPLRKEQMQMVRAVGEVFALNVVIDEGRRIGFVNFGQIDRSHLEAVDFMRRYAEVPVPHRFHTVVTTSAGYPLDKTYYQTIKGMVGVLGILEPGGTVIIASECSEGMGSAEFVSAQRILHRLGVEGFMEEIMGRGQARIDEWQTQMLAKVLRVGKVGLYSTGLNPADRADSCVTLIDDLRAAIEESVHGTVDRRIAVVPEGPYVIPLHRPGR
jgi:nickel-dependent lactate racemase